MNAFSLIIANLRHQKLAHALNLSLMAFATALIAALLLAQSQIENRLARDAQGVDLVIGAKGSPLQLILSAVYQLDAPTGNISYEAAQRWAKNPLIARAVPLSLGDSARGYRIVGTEPGYVDLHGAQFAQGRLWNQPMEAVIGADVAASGLALDASFNGAHGLAGGHEHADAYRVVGILKPAGSVIDRLILTSLESVWDLHGEHENEHEREAHEEPREITALLLTFKSPLAAATLPRQINAEAGLQSAAPATELLRLLSLIGVGVDALNALGGLLLTVAALALFAALYNAMETRQYDIAVLRALGATRGAVAALLIGESLTLALIGTLLGLLLAHGALEVIGRWAETAHGFPLTGLTWAPQETALPLLALGVGLIAALLPALRAYRTDVAAVLSQ